MEITKSETSFATATADLDPRAAGIEQALPPANNQTFDSSGVTIGTRQFWVTGIFTDRASAERAHNSVLSRGYDEKEINLMMSDETRQQYFSDEPVTDLAAKSPCAD